MTRFVPPTLFAMHRTLAALVLLSICVWVVGAARPLRRGDISASLPVLYSSAELHGRLPTACAIDEAAGELIVIDDNTRIAALSLKDGRVLRQVDGIVRPDLGLYAEVDTLAVQPRPNNTSLLWLALSEDWTDTPHGSLLVVDSRDLSTIVFTIAWNDTTPPIDINWNIVSLHASTHGELMHALVEGLYPLNYVFNTTTGRQVDSYHAPNGAAMLAVSRNSSTGDEQLVFVPNANGYVDSVHVTQLDGLPLYTVPIYGVPPIQLSALADVVAVDIQQRLWLMDEVNTLYAFNLTTGQQVSNVSWSLSDDTFPPHFAALSADGERAYVMAAVSAYTVVIDTSTGDQVAQWQSEQQPLYLPLSATFDDSNATFSERHIIVNDLLSQMRGQLHRVSLSDLPLATVPVEIDDQVDTVTRSILVDYASGPTYGDLWVLTEWNPLNDSTLHSNVYHFTGNGSLVGSFEAADSLLVQLAWGSNHTFWATEFIYSTAERWSDMGSLLTSLPLDGRGQSWLWGIAELNWLTAEHDEVTVAIVTHQRVVELSLNGTELRTIDSDEGTNALPKLLVADNARRIVYSVNCLFIESSVLPKYCWVRALHQLSNQSWVAVAELRPQPFLAHPWFVSLALSSDGQQLLVVDGEYNRLLLWNVTAVQQLVEQRESADAGSNSSKQRHAYVPSSAKRASQLVEQ